MPHATDAARCPFWRPWEDCTQRDNTVMTAALHTSGSSPASCSAQPTLACSPLERLSLTASLAPLLANRTIQFLGDSVQTQLFAAFACRLHAMGWRYTGRLNWLSTRSKWGVRRRVKSQLCAGREDMCHYESGCITELSIGSTICVSQIIALPSPEVLSYLSTQRLRRRRDVLMYGTVGAHLTQLERTSAGALRPVIASWQEDAAREVALVHGMRRFKGTLVWREMTATHFDSTPSGSYLLGDEGNARCAERQLDDMRIAVVGPAPWNDLTVPLVNTRGTATLRLWESSAHAWYGHVGEAFIGGAKSGNQTAVDCVHFCPAVTWQWAGMLVRKIVSGELLKQ